ncbi:MAG: hypothetical protein HKN91_05295, partial [Acidimicrobiia bacterium]|nr:hypothetical protein [Acidimicrobiia bacterium]
MNLAKMAVAGLGGWNYLINRRIEPDRYVVANLSAAAAILAIGLRRASPTQLGLRMSSGLP